MVVDSFTYTDVHLGKTWRRMDDQGGCVTAEVGGGENRQGGAGREERSGSGRLRSGGRGRRARRPMRECRWSRRFGGSRSHGHGFELYPPITPSNIRIVIQKSKC